MEPLSDYMLASEVPDELVCLLCKNIASEPLQVSCCGQVFCKQCINAAKKSAGNICIKCHKKWGIDIPDKKRKKDIENIMVRCYVASERGGGCSWEGTLKELRTHKSECKWRIITCSHCQETVYWKDAEVHERDSCPSRHYECPHCPYSGTYEQVTIVHYIDGRCPDQELTCPNGCVIRSHELESHAMRCPNIPCRFSEIGCNALMSRSETEAHERDNQMHHLHLAIEKIASLSNTVDRLRSEAQLMARKPIAVFRMKKEDYEQLRTSLQPWTSPSVYTHDRGYNLHLKVSTQDGKTLSLTVHLLPGRYDDELPWPCQAQVTVEMLNQTCDSGHHTCTVDLEALEAKRAYEPDQAGYGPKDFISFDQLGYNPASNTQYIKGDYCMYFRVRVGCDSVYQPWLSEFVWHRDKGTI